MLVLVPQSCLRRGARRFLKCDLGEGVEVVVALMGTEERRGVLEMASSLAAGKIVAGAVVAILPLSWKGGKCSAEKARLILRMGVVAVCSMAAMRKA